MTIVSIAILVGVIFLVQHIELNQNQDNVLENQALLKKLMQDAKNHEIREETLLFHNTAKNINVSSNNSEKLDRLLDYFNMTE